MAQKEFTNVWTYVVIIFIYVVFIGAIRGFAEHQLNNSDSNLDAESLEYIYTILDIDISNYEVTASELENNELDDSTNATGSSAKDNSLEFFYGKSQAEKTQDYIKDIFSLPSFIAKLLKIPIKPISLFIGLLDWFWRIGIIIAGYYFIRGVK